MTSPSRELRSRLARLALATGLAAISAGPVRAQSISVNAGSTGSAIVAPSGKLTVPVIIDLASAGPLNIASLQTGMSWGASQLTFDSLRVVVATGWTLFPNLGGAGGGAITFAAFNSVALPATATLANAYFTASPVAGGTRVVLTPTAGGSDAGGDILAALRARALDVCIATTVKWGDVNANGVVDIIDAQQITRYSAGLSVANLTALLERGDVTADGFVNIIDAQQIARFSVGLSAAARINTDFVVVPATTSMTLSPSTPQTLLVGNSGQITATPASGATDLTGCAGVTWGSSNSAVAVVNASGFVTAVSAGSATISATSGAVTTPVTVNVVGVPVASVSVALGAAAIQVGTTTTATATMRDAANNVLAGRTVVYSSGNTSIATVNPGTGVVTGVAAGATNIFATSEGITGSAAVTVTTGVPVASVSVALGSASIQVGATTTGTATTRDALNNVLVGRPITWTSSNPAVATVNVSTGLVTGVAAGSANIIATADGVSGQAALTVTVPPVASVTVSLGSASVQVGNTTTATATTRDAGSNILTGRIVTFSSSNTSVATVNPTTGLVTAVAAGTANIFATSEGITGQATVTVTTVGPVATVTVTLASTSILVGATTQATATLQDAASNIVSGTTTWSSSNTAVATVNATTGLVTAVAAGTANIIGTSNARTGQRALTVSAVPVASVTVALAPGTVSIGSTSAGAATTYDASSNILTGRVVAWSSSNTAIATVNAATGVVTAVAVGTANILATSESRVGQAAVTVTLVPVNTVTVSLASSTITTGATTTATATLRDASNNTLTGRAVAWSSSNTARATVNATTGVVTGVSAGTANIIATSEGKTGQAAVTVSAPPTVASVTVTLAASTVAPGGNTSATGVARDASSAVISGAVVTWSSSNTAVATVNSSTGAVTAVAVGTANIIGTSGGITGQAALTVAVQTSNEPVGMTQITDRPFNCVKLTCETDWTYQDFGNGSVTTIVSDPTAPKSPPNVGAVLYPTGLPGGQGVGEVYRAIGTYKTLYISAWIKFSDNWVGNPTGNNKMLYFYMNNQLLLITEAVGAGSASLFTTNYLFFLGAAYPWYPNPFGSPYSDQNPSLGANVTNKEVKRGVWHRYEYVINVGTAGTANGSFEAWLDGVKTHNFTGIMWRGSGVSTDFSYIQWEPIWGGSTGTIAAPQYQYMDHIYLSGKQ